MTAFTVDVSDSLAKKLDQLAEIEAALAEADRGDFASDEEFLRVIGKYLKPANEQ